MNKFAPVCCLLVALSSPFGSEASEEQTDARANIAKKFPGARNEDVKPSVVNGLYEVRIGADTAYVSSDGEYLIAGELYEIDSQRNLTEARRAEERARIINGLKESEMIVFAPRTSPKHTITVFTDVECGYCRKLHQEIEALNSMGVRVRYLAFPASGPGTPAWTTMEQVWCAKDRNAALTSAKAGGRVHAAQRCETSPIARHYQLAEAIGVRGTPAIYTSNGEHVGGYLPPEELRKRLDKVAADASKAASKERAAN